MQSPSANPIVSTSGAYNVPELVSSNSLPDLRSYRTTAIALSLPELLAVSPKQEVSKNKAATAATLHFFTFFILFVF
ncbi:hypothetical protein Barb7_02212 [Bacteroidales bacterium Barb7]|nr:hypothetical protein Barb7_02212 [Bacteroidales bacterium Barb7]